MTEAELEKQDGGCIATQRTTKPTIQCRCAGRRRAGRARHAGGALGRSAWARGAGGCADAGQAAATRSRGQLLHGHNYCDTAPVRALGAAMRSPGCAAGPTGCALGALSLF